jgi:proteasome assembly chaperone (PAC2) family protein
LKWKTFTSTFLEVCKYFHASEILLLGAFLANIPHSLDVPVSGLSSTEDMQERLSEIDVQGTRYEGPTGIVGVLQEAISKEKIPVSSLWAAAPHYLVATPNIKVTAALLAYMNTFMSFDLDLSDIQSDAVNFEEQITRLVARDPDASAYVRKLEEQIENAGQDDDDENEEDEEEDEASPINPDRPTGTGPLPSADTLIRRVEELLRKERENNQGNGESSEGNE